MYSFFFAKVKPVLMVLGVECWQVPVHGVFEVSPAKARAKSSAYASLVDNVIGISLI